MSDEQDTTIVFPKPEGPFRHQVEPEKPTDGGGEAPSKKLLLPGADGFAQQTTFTVDNSTPGSLVIVPPIDDPTLGGLIVPVAGTTDKGRVAAHLGLGWSFNDRGMVVNECNFGRFVLANSKTFNRITAIMSSIGPADNTLDFGIYNGTGTSRIVSAGATAVGGAAFPPNQKTLAVPLTTLLGGVLYTAAMVWSRGTVGAAANYAACSYGGGPSAVQIGGSSVTTVQSGTVALVSGVLPADLSTAGAFGANGSVAPFFILWRA